MECGETQMSSLSAHGIKVDLIFSASATTDPVSHILMNVVKCCLIAGR